MTSDGNLAEIISGFIYRKHVVEARSSLFPYDFEDSEMVTVRPYSVRSLSRSRDIRLSDMSCVQLQP